MARQVLPIVGGIVGAFFGVPQLGFALGSVVGALVDPATAQGPKLGELAVQRSNEGMPRAIIYGTATCTGYILDFGPPIKTKEVVSGEKGAPKSEQEVVYRNYAIAICEGPISGVLRVWENDKLVYDIRPGSLMLAESLQWKANKVFYGGTEDQLPDVFLELNVSGPGETPAYRGTAYMVVGLEDLTNSLGAIPQYRWEVAIETEQGSWPDYGWSVVQETEWTSLPALATDGEGLVVAVGLGDADESWYSTDMQNWFAVELPNGANHIAYGNGGFVAIDGGNNDTVWYGAGTGTWTDDPLEEIIDKTGIAFGNGIFVITAAGNSYTGTGGGTGWTKNEPAVDPVGPVRFGNGVFVSLQPNQVCVSANGVTWTAHAAPMASPNDIKWVPGLSLWVLMGGGSNAIATSPDLVTWTPRSTPSVTYYSGAWSPDFGVFVAIGDGGAFVTSEDLVTWTARTPIGGSLNDLIWEPVEGKFVGVASSTARIVVSNTTVGTFAGLPVALSDIVSDLHSRSAIPEEDFDVSELTDMVEGLTLTGDYTAADAINTLRSCYFFDKAEPGDKLYYPKRGKPVVMTLDFDDLVDVPDLSKRDQVAEVPKKVHLQFQNATAGYAPVKATYERSTVDVKSIVETTIEVPVVLSMDEGQQMVHKQHKVLTADAQGEIKLTIPDRLIKLIPSDNIGLSLRGQVRRLRIDECEWSDGVLSQTLRTDRQSAYTSNLTGIAIPEPMLPPSTIVGDTVFVFADVASRIDSEDDLHYLVAGVGSLPGWYGWYLQRSLDAGANYANVEQFNVADVIGSLVDDVPAASEHYTDTTNTVRVQLFRDSSQSLEDLTEVQFLAEGGAFLLEKEDGSYEVMQYRDADDEGDGIYALTTLHRGRLNSGASAHTAGARFVMLSSAHHIPAQSAWIGQAITHRPVSLGESPELATEQTDTYVGRSQLEWPVAYLTLARSGADVITATWTPRHRFGTDDAPVASINFQGYRVTLDDGALPPVTFDTTTAGFTYDASALGASVTVSVSALNRITGAGPATSGSV